MRSLIFSGCLLTAARSVSAPASDSQVYVLLDATTWDKAQLDLASRTAAKQFSDLISTYEQAGLSLEVAVGSFGAATGTCYKHIQDFTAEYSEMDAALQDAEQYDVISSVHQFERNTFNAIMHAAATNFFRKDKYTRRIVMIISDDIGDFGNGNDDDAYFANCPQTRPTAEKFSEVVQDNEVGVLFSIQATYEGSADLKVSSVRELFDKTSLTDIFLDGNFDEAGWDSVKVHLTNMVSKDWIATTSTTTIKTTSTNFKVNPDRDVELFFLLDAATADTDGVHLSFGTQMMIDQLDELFKSVESSGYTLSVGADSFGALSGTCYKSLMSLTSDYAQVRKEMSNPPTFDADLVTEGSNRNTYNALIHATSILSKSDEVRRVLVLLTNYVPSFGSGSKDPSACPQEQASVTQLKSAFEDSRSGLLITVLAKDNATAESSQAAIKAIVDQTGLTDISYNGDFSEESWDAITYHAAMMISREFTASTSTTTKTVSERIKACIAEALACDA